MRKGKDPDPYLWLMDPDPGGPKTCGSRGSRSGFGSGSNIGELQKKPIYLILGKLFFHSVSRLNLVALNASACCSTVSRTCEAISNISVSISPLLQYWKNYDDKLTTFICVKKYLNICRSFTGLRLCWKFLRSDILNWGGFKIHSSVKL